LADQPRSLEQRHFNKSRWIGYNAGMVSFLKILAASVMIATCQISAVYYLYGAYRGAAPLLFPFFVSMILCGAVAYLSLPARWPPLNRALGAGAIAFAVAFIAEIQAVSLPFTRFGE
jgi:hypothetical protein